MNQKAYQGVFPAKVVVVMVTFLAAIFFAHPNPSFAASSKKKTSAVARTSAVEYTETQIKQLQGSLKVTKEQEELWNNLTQVMRENAKEMDALSKDRAENTKDMNAVEHLKFHSQITETHLNQQKKLIPTFEAFYTSLSDEQMKIADTIFKTGKYGKKRMK
jgi:hypothetical protein